MIIPVPGNMITLKNIELEVTMTEVVDSATGELIVEGKDAYGNFVTLLIRKHMRIHSDYASTQRGIYIVEQE